MSTNGLSLYNVGNSLDLEALTRAGAQNGSHHDDDTDDDGEEENQKRNAELQDLLTNAFDDLIEDEAASEMENNNSNYDHSAVGQINKSERMDSSKLFGAKSQEFTGDSLYSPLHLHQGDLLSETQYQGEDSPSPNLATTFDTLSQHNHKKHCVRFSPLNEQEENSSKMPWKVHQDSNKGDDREQHYLSSGLNSQAELEVLYASRGAEIKKLTLELHQLQHKAALAEGEKNGMKMTLETSDRLLQDCREDNRRLSEEIQSLNHKVAKLSEANHELSSKLEASENNAVALERQILNLNLLEASHRDANRQEVLLNGMKARYENDLRMLRDELNRVRAELEQKTESVISLERKLRDVTEMHERTLQERAANLQEFNRALDQQRMLREQRDTLTSATLLDQLSKAQDEIERLRAERLSQNLSDSMSQLRLAPNHKDHSDFKQTETIRILEQRLQTSEKTIQRLEEAGRQLQKEKDALSKEFVTTTQEIQSISKEKERLTTELSTVKELYLSMCKEKDSVEEQLHRVTSEKEMLDLEQKQLLKDMEDMNNNMEENLSRQKAIMQTNWESKMQTAIQEQVARARLEWLKEKTQGQTDDLVHVEKSLNELQGLRHAMDALRNERDILQNELTRRQQQLKLERHLLREKFTIEKEMLIKTWQEKIASAATVDKTESIQQDKSLITATADAMARLRQQCEEEKLSIIASYEKQLLELQSHSSTPQQAQPAEIADWRLELSKVKMGLKNHQVSADVLFSFDQAIQKMEVSWRRDQNELKYQTEKYKQLKRRVRDYQKYVNEKLSKYKTDREQSEVYCRRVISELLSKVTQELQRLEADRNHANLQVPHTAHQSTTAMSVNGPTSNGLQPGPGTTFAQSIDDLQEQVNRYVLGLTQFTNGMK